MMKEKVRKKLETAVQKANISLREDVFSLIKSAYRREKSPRGKKALGWIMENAFVAKKRKLPLCQDTGLPIVVVELGRGAVVEAGFIQEVKRVVEIAYGENFFRPSLVDPLKRRPASYGPVLVHIELNLKIRDVKLTVLPKGFGSENKTRLKMFNPTASKEAIEEFVIESVQRAGPEACPPFVVGIGIGGTSERALFLAKYALLDDLRKNAANKTITAWQRKILKKINALNIGPMGLGGKTSALAVKIKTAPTHIAGLPVGVNISCWALRSSSFTVSGREI